MLFDFLPIRHLFSFKTPPFFLTLLVCLAWTSFRIQTQEPLPPVPGYTIAKVTEPNTSWTTSLLQSNAHFSISVRLFVCSLLRRRRHKKFNFFFLFISFRSSSTIVKHAGFNNTATAAFNFLPTQQSSDNRWGPEFPDGKQTIIATFCSSIPYTTSLLPYPPKGPPFSHELDSCIVIDARVPRLGGSYHEDSPTADMAGHTFLSQTQGNNMESSLGPGLDLSTTNSRTGSSTLKSDGSGVISSAPFRYPGLNPGSDFSMPKPVPMSMSLPLLHQSPSQMMQQQGLSAATGGGDSSVYGGASEIVTEMPPPLANLRTRKGNRCSRLNDKYARMKV